MEIVKVPDGETKESFLKVKIHNINRTIEMFKCIADDKECFDSDTLLMLSMMEFQLQNILNIFEREQQ